MIFKTSVFVYLLCSFSCVFASTDNGNQDIPVPTQSYRSPSTPFPQNNQNPSGMINEREKSRTSVNDTTPSTPCRNLVIIRRGIFSCEAH